MPAALDHVVDLIFGRWRSQILHAGAALDIFDHLKLGQDRPALSVASEINADVPMLYRLLRALATIGLVEENDENGFRLTKQAHCFEQIIPNRYAPWRCWKKGRSITLFGSISSQ
jgi:hypothetical protein